MQSFGLALMGGYCLAKSVTEGDLALLVWAGNCSISALF